MKKSFWTRFRGWFSRSDGYSGQSSRPNKKARQKTGQKAKAGDFVRRPSFPRTYASLRTRKDAAIRRLRRRGINDPQRVLDILANEFHCGVEKDKHGSWLSVDHPGDLTVFLDSTGFSIERFGRQM